MLVGMAERGARQGLVGQPGRKAAGKPAADKPVADRIAADYSPAAGCRLAAVADKPAVAHKHAGGQRPLPVPAEDERLLPVGVLRPLPVPAEDERLLPVGVLRPLPVHAEDERPLPVGVLRPLLALVGDMLPLLVPAEDVLPLPVPVVCERPLQLRGQAVVGLLVLQSSVRNKGRTYSRC